MTTDTEPTAEQLAAAIEIQHRDANLTRLKHYRAQLKKLVGDLDSEIMEQEEERKKAKGEWNRLNQ